VFTYLVLLAAMVGIGAALFPFRDLNEWLAERYWHRLQDERRRRLAQPESQIESQIEEL
jgi:hypothetical protein